MVQGMVPAQEFESRFSFYLGAYSCVTLLGAKSLEQTEKIQV